MPAVPMVEAGEANKNLNFNDAKRRNNFFRTVSSHVTGKYKLLPLKNHKACKGMGWTKNYKKASYFKCLRAYKAYKLPKHCDANQTFIIGGLIPQKGDPFIATLTWSTQAENTARVKKANNINKLAKNYAKVINEEVKKLTRCVKK